jgi:hypothetical protein
MPIAITAALSYATLCRSQTTRVTPPLEALARIAGRADADLHRELRVGDERHTPHFFLYDLLRREQALAAGSQPARSETARILDFAQAAYGDLAGLLVGRDDALLESVRDGEWTLRDILRHAIAVELRYAAQVEWSAGRRDDEPLAVPDSRLPCDRLSPPDDGFGESRTGGIVRMVELLGMARARTDAQLASLSDGTLGRPSLWGTYEMDVRRRLHQIAAHLTETAVQIEKALSVEGDFEARRIVRRCAMVRGLHERWTEADARSALDERYRALAT